MKTFTWVPPETAKLATLPFITMESCQQYLVPISSFQRQINDTLPKR